MDKKILIILLFLTFCSAKSQENFREFKYYDIYEDYVSNKPIEPILNTEIKELNSEYIKIGKKFDKITNKKSKIENSAWALEYQNNLYFNMIYASYIYEWDTFAKFDIIGKNYMLVILDEKKERKAIGTNNPYGGSAVGVLLNMKPKSSWLDNKGNTFKILLIDRINPLRIKASGIKNVLAYLVDTKKILELSQNNPETIEKLKNQNYKLEDFVELINILNK